MNDWSRHDRPEEMTQIYRQSKIAVKIPWMISHANLDIQGEGIEYVAPKFLADGTSTNRF
jgi:hypothetical protein